MLYRRRNKLWFKFVWRGRVIRESAHTGSRDIAQRAERRRHRELEEGINQLGPATQPSLFSVAAQTWLQGKVATLAAKSYAIERINLSHLLPVFGKKLLTDLTAEHIQNYQSARLRAGAAAKTVNLELGTLRALLRKHRLWAALQPDVKMLKVRTDVGHALSKAEETKLVKALKASRSRSIYPAVLLALHTGMRLGEIRALRWAQVDLSRKTLRVGQAKTEAGSGRVIPLNAPALRALRAWATHFPEREPDHYVFPSEKYGIAGNDRTPVVYAVDPSVPLASWKVAWGEAKAVSGVRVRFHDLRHSACSRMLERGAPLPVVSALLGWSAATTARMAKRYGHMSEQAQRKAVDLLALGGHTG